MWRRHPPVTAAVRTTRAASARLRLAPDRRAPPPARPSSTRCMRARREPRAGPPKARACRTGRVALRTEHHVPRPPPPAGHGPGASGLQRGLRRCRPPATGEPRRSRSDPRERIVVVVRPVAFAAGARHNASGTAVVRARRVNGVLLVVAGAPRRQVSLAVFERGAVLAVRKGSVV